MRNSLYIISLGIFIVSCSTQQTAKKIAAQPIATPAKTLPPPKPEVKHNVHGDYYTVNIADTSKGDNTISYGSIVTAKPDHYKVIRDFFPAVAQNFRQKYVILHYTALDHNKSTMVLTQQSVSSHYLVNDKDDKDIYQLVDENKRAYHAGISSWRNDKQLNDTSIGIEIVNNGFTTVNGKKVFVEFPEYQVKKVAELVQDLAKRYQIPPTNIIAHADIAPTRKQDPGPKFPWKKLYTDYQIGMWYDDTTKQSLMSQITPEDFSAQYNNASFIFKVQIELGKLGYGIEQSGTWDDATKKTIEAFQYHFRPENYDGIMDSETWAILQALTQKYPSK